MTARLLMNQIDKDSDPQPLTSAEAQESLATMTQESLQKCIRFIICAAFVGKPTRTGSVQKDSFYKNRKIQGAV